VSVIKYTCGGENEVFFQKNKASSGRRMRHAHNHRPRNTKKSMKTEGGGMMGAQCPICDTQSSGRNHFAIPSDEREGSRRWEERGAIAESISKKQARKLSARNHPASERGWRAVPSIPGAKKEEREPAECRSTRWKEVRWVKKDLKSSHPSVIC